MPERNDKSGAAPWGKAVADAALGAHDEIWKPVIKEVTRIAPKAAGAVKKITGAPGAIYNGAYAWTAPDPLREMIGIGGGVIGTAAGGAAGAAAGGVNAPIGAVAGGPSARTSPRASTTNTPTNRTWPKRGEA